MIVRGLTHRRSQSDRAKARARRLLSRIFLWDPEEITPKVIGRHAKDRVICSCSMCGNPRRFDGQRTRQELRATDPTTGEVEGQSKVNPNP
jgi:hypothetical protein